MQVQQFLESSAERLPDKVALVCGDRHLTYRYLDQAANRLAQALRTAGVRRGDRVAILLENSAETVVAIFEALKAGGAFMVLHPDTKRDKLTYLLDDAEPAALVTAHSRVAQAADAVAAASSLRAVVWVGDDALPLGASQRSIPWSELDGYPSDCPSHGSIDVDLGVCLS